jgi:pyruvate ferredoxin oxidoreductase beta subunit
VVLPKTDLFEIWRAQKPPYVATITAHEAVDLAEKVHRSLALAGPRLFLALAVCPTGWGFDPELSEEIAHLAVETGVWPLKEAVHGAVRHTYIPDRLRPVAEYLEPQRRFHHLFRPRRRDDLIGAIQAQVDAYWQQVRAAELGKVERNP